MTTWILFVLAGALAFWASAEAIKLMFPHLTDRKVFTLMVWTWCAVGAFRMFWVLGDRV